jgi:hypothetical protein
VSAWNPRRMLPRASRSLARFCAFCHVCWSGRQRATPRRHCAPYQDLVVSLSEACQTLLRVVWCGLLLLGGAAEEPHPLLLSAMRAHSGGHTYEVHLDMQSPRIRAVYVGDARYDSVRPDRVQGPGGSSFETEPWTPSQPSSQPSSNARRAPPPIARMCTSRRSRPPLRQLSLF